MKILSRLSHYIREGLRTIRIFSNWITVLWTYFHPENKTVIAKLRKGAKFRIRKNRVDAYVIREIVIDKIYDDDIGRLKEDSVVIDIGGNIGVFSVLAAGQSKGVTVYSYEPFEENFLLLKENIALNRMEQQIYPFSYAVGSAKCEKVVFLDKADAESSIYGEKGKEVLIKILSLENIFVENNIRKCDLLKIDCEGAEYEILYATPTYIFERVESISMEFHEKFRTGGGKALEVFLEKKGFQVDRREKTENLGFIYAQKPH